MRPIEPSASGLRVGSKLLLLLITLSASCAFSSGISPKERLALYKARGLTDAQRGMCRLFGQDDSDSCLRWHACADSCGAELQPQGDECRWRCLPEQAGTGEISERFPAMSCLIFLQEGNLRRAQWYADEAVRTDPSTPQGFVCQGELARQNGETEAAFAYYRQAVALDPTEVYPRVALGRMLCDLNELEQAEAVFRDALAYHVWGAWLDDALEGLASVYSRQGKIDAARETLKKCIEAYPSSEDCAAALAKLGP